MAKKYRAELTALIEQHKNDSSQPKEDRKPPKEPQYEISVEDVQADWVNTYNWKIQPRTGPYNIHSYIKGKEVVFKRNENWWAKDKKLYKYRYNVDYIRYTIVRDNNLAFEKFKLGELDQFSLVLPNYWHSKAKYMDPVDMGYMQKNMVLHSTAPAIIPNQL